MTSVQNTEAKSDDPHQAILVVDALGRQLNCSFSQTIGILASRCSALLSKCAMVQLKHLSRDPVTDLQQMGTAAVYSSAAQKQTCQTDLQGSRRGFCFAAKKSAVKARLNIKETKLKAALQKRALSIAAAGYLLDRWIILDTGSHHLGSSPPDGGMAVLQQTE